MLTPRFRVTLSTRAGRVVHQDVVQAETPGDARTRVIREKYGPRVFWDAAEDEPRAGRVVDLLERRRGLKTRLVEKPLTPCLALKIERLSPTGRTPSKPALQNIPIRTETGRQIREAFRGKRT